MNPNNPSSQGPREITPEQRRQLQAELDVMMQAGRLNKALKARFRKVAEAMQFPSEEIDIIIDELAERFIAYEGEVIDQNNKSGHENGAEKTRPNIDAVMQFIVDRMAKIKVVEPPANGQQPSVSAGKESADTKSRGLKAGLPEDGQQSVSNNGQETGQESSPDALTASIQTKEEVENAFQRFHKGRQDASRYSPIAKNVQEFFGDASISDEASAKFLDAYHAWIAARSVESEQSETADLFRRQAKEKVDDLLAHLRNGRSRKAQEAEPPKDEAAEPEKQSATPEKMPSTEAQTEKPPVTQTGTAESLHTDYEKKAKEFLYFLDADETGFGKNVKDDNAKVHAVLKNIFGKNASLMKSLDPLQKQMLCIIGRDYYNTDVDKRSQKRPKATKEIAAIFAEAERSSTPDASQNQPGSATVELPKDNVYLFGNGKEKFDSRQMPKQIQKPTDAEWFFCKFADIIVHNRDFRNTKDDAQLFLMDCFVKAKFTRSAHIAHPEFYAGFQEWLACLRDSSKKGRALAATHMWINAINAPVEEPEILFDDEAAHPESAAREKQAKETATMQEILEKFSADTSAKNPKAAHNFFAALREQGFEITEADPWKKILQEAAKYPDSPEKRQGFARAFLEDLQKSNGTKKMPAKIPNNGAKNGELPTAENAKPAGANGKAADNTPKAPPANPASKPQEEKQKPAAGTEDGEGGEGPQEVKEEDLEQEKQDAKNKHTSYFEQQARELLLEKPTTWQQKADFLYRARQLLPRVQGAKISQKLEQALRNTAADVETNYLQEDLRRVLIESRWKAGWNEIRPLRFEEDEYATSVPQGTRDGIESLFFTFRKQVFLGYVKNNPQGVKEAMHIPSQAYHMFHRAFLLWLEYREKNDAETGRRLNAIVDEMARDLQRKEVRLKNPEPPSMPEPQVVIPIPLKPRPPMSKEAAQKAIDLFLKTKGNSTQALMYKAFKGEGKHVPVKGKPAKIDTGRSAARAAEARRKAGLPPKESVHEEPATIPLHPPTTAKAQEAPPKPKEAAAEQPKAAEKPKENLPAKAA